MDHGISVEEQDQPSTHSTRNPDKPVIPPRYNYKKLSQAEKETRKVARELKQEKKKELQTAVNTFLTQRDAFAAELAEKFSMDVEKARKMLNGALTFKNQRTENTWNALVRRRGLELNEGRAKGERYSLTEIQKKVREEKENGLHNDVDDDILRNKLKEARELKLKGARSSNLAAAVDYNGTARRITTELENLRERCGTMGFAFITRGHINDTVVPSWIESQGSLAFVNEVLGIAPAELLRKFDQWACAKDRTPATPTIELLRSQCVNRIITGLQGITRKTNVSMHYEKYEAKIVQGLGVLLVGWPEGIKFQSPAKITTMEEAKSLDEALACGECKWVKIGRLEQQARAKKLQESVANGAVTAKPARATRADKGKKRGPRTGKTGEKRKQIDGAESDDNDHAHHSKKKRPSGRQIPPMPQSKEFVSSSESDSSEDSD